MFSWRRTFVFCCVAALMYVMTSRGTDIPIMLGRPEARNACFWDLPCLDLGRCVETEAPPFFRCDCYDAFYEENKTCSCDGWLAPCLRSQCAVLRDEACENGGTCHDTWGGYACECPPGWQGDECQTKAPTELRRFVPPVQLLYDVDAFTAVPATFVLVMRRGATGHNFSAEVGFGDGPLRVVTAAMLSSSRLSLPLRSRRHLKQALPRPPLLHYTMKHTFYVKDTVVKVSLKVINGGVDQYRTSMQVHVRPDPRRCTPDVEIIDCGQTKEFVGPMHRSLKKRPRWFRTDKYVLRSRVTPDCWGVGSSVVYQWRLCRKHGECVPTAQPKTRMHFTVAPFSLSYGVYEVRLTVREVVRDETYVRSFQNEGRCSFEMTASPITAIIEGGFSISVTPGRTLVVNGSRSHDPNYPGRSSHLSFAWNCAAEDRYMSVCDEVVDRNDYLLLPGKYLTTDVVVNFTLVVSDGYTESTPVRQKVTVTTAQSPRLRVICQSNCAYNEPLDAERTVALRVDCIRYCEGEDSKDFYTWTVLDLAESKWKPKLYFGQHSPYFYLLGGVLQTDTYYVVTVEGGFGKKTMRTVGLHIGRSPSLGHCDVSPQEGVAGKTRFNIGCHNFDNFENSDMVYEFYQLDVGVKGDAGVLLEYGYNPVVFTYLMPGVADNGYSTTLHMRIISGSGLRTSFNITLKVTPPPYLILPSTHACQALLSPNKYAFHDTSEMVRQVMLAAESSVMLDPTLLEGREQCFLEMLQEVPLYATDAVMQVTVALRRLLSHSAFIGVHERGRAARALRDATAALADIVGEDRFDGFVLYHARDVADAILWSVGAIIGQVENACEVQADDYELDYPVYSDLEPLCVDSKLHNERAMAHVLATLSTSGRMIDKMQLVSDPVKRYISPTKVLFVWFQRFLPTGLPHSIDCSEARTNTVQLSEAVRHHFSDKRVPVGLLVAVILGNPFWWYRTGISVSTPLLLVECPTLGAMRLPAPVEFLLNVTEHSGLGGEPVNGTLNATEDWSDPDSAEMNLALHLVVADQGEVPVLIFDALPSDAPLKVVATVGRRPSLADFERLGVVVPTGEAGLERYVAREAAQADDTFVYLGLIPANRKLSSDVAYTMTVLLTRCQFWDNRAKSWSSEGCQVGQKTDGKSVHCYCHHLSVFSGRSLLLPDRLDVLQTMTMSLKATMYPYVLIAVILALLLFFLLFLCAFLRDRKDDCAKEIIFLSDNIPGYSYVYLVGVFTGNKWNATSSSRVGIQIVGDRYKCRHHLLLGYRESPLVRNTDSWFVLLTRLDLGELQTLRLWHDHSGEAPSWYCSRVTVVDVQRDRQWTFVVEDWLTAGMDGANTYLLVAATPSKRLDAFSTQFPAQLQSLARTLHPWVRVLTSHPRTHKVAVLFASVLLHMLVCILMFGFPRGGPADTIEKGMASPSTSHLTVAVATAFAGFAVTLLLTLLFVKTRPRSYRAVTVQGKAGVVDADDLSRADARALQPLRWTSVPERLESVAGQLLRFFTDEPLVFDEVVSRRVLDFPELQTPVAQRRLRTYVLRGDADATGHRRYWFPHFFVYVAWALCMVVGLGAAALILLCGLVYGREESLAWAWTTLAALGLSALVLFPIAILVAAACFSSPRVAQKRRDAVDAGGTLRVVTDAHYPREERSLRAYLLKLNLLRKTDPYRPMGLARVRTLRDAQRRRHVLRDAVIDALLFGVFLLLAYFIVAVGRDSLLQSKAQVLRWALISGYASGLGTRQLRDADDLMTYVRSTALPLLYETLRYNGGAVPTAGWTQDAHVFLVGISRLRQKRVKPNTCRFPATLADDTRRCDAELSRANNDVKSRSLRWSDSAFWSQDTVTVKMPWQHQRSTGSWPCEGRLASYGDGGYVALLGRTRVNSLAIEKFLASNDWADPRWRAIFLEFVNFAPDRNLVGADVVVAERSATGLVVASVRCCVVALPPDGDVWDAFVTLATLLLLALLVVLVWLQFLKFIHGGRWYYRRPWVCVDVACTVLAAACVVLVFVSRGVRRRTLTTLEESEGNDFVGFEDACRTDALLSLFLALLTGVATVRLWKLLSAGVECELVDAAMRAWRVPVLATLVAVTWVVVTLALSWHLRMAAASWQFRTALHSVLCVLAATLGYGSHPQPPSTLFAVLSVAARLLLLGAVVAILLLYFRNANYVFARRPPAPSTLRRLVDALRNRKNRRRLRGGADVVKRWPPGVVVPRVSRTLDVAEKRLLRAKRRLMAVLALRGEPRRERLTSVALNAVAGQTRVATPCEVFYRGFEVDGVAKLVPVMRLVHAKGLVQSLVADVPSRTEEVETAVALVPWENDYGVDWMSMQLDLDWAPTTDVVAQAASSAASSSSSQSASRLLTVTVAARGDSSSTSSVTCRCDSTPEVYIKVGAIDSLLRATDADAGTLTPSVPCCGDASETSLNLVVSNDGEGGVRLVVAAEDDQQLQGVRILVLREGRDHVKVLIQRR